MSTPVRSPDHRIPQRAGSPDLVEATSQSQLDVTRALFLEYAKSLAFSLCFQSFDQELASLPGQYAAPQGRLLLAYVGGESAGCGALRPLDMTNGICEIKRIYVRPQFRGSGLGRKLTLALIEAAHGIGYRGMRLETVPDRMREAVALYRTLGFREIQPYEATPKPGTLYMELAPLFACS